MTKTVFDNQGVAHAFASRSQDQGRSNNGNFYFTGDTLYSYGTHFPIARFYGDVVLINSDSYSVSTSRCQRYAERALNHFESVYLPNLRDVCEIIHYRDKATRTRLATTYIRDLASSIATLEEKLPRMRAEWKINQTRSEISALEQSAYFVWVTICKRRGNPLNAAMKLHKKEMKAKIRAKFERDFEHVEQCLEIDVEQSIKTANESKPENGAEYYKWYRWSENIQLKINGVFRDAVGPLQIKESRKIMGVTWSNNALRIQKKRDEKLAPLHDLLLSALKARDVAIVKVNPPMIHG